MRKVTSVLILMLLALPSVSSAVALTPQQSSSLIAVVQSSPGTPASAFVSLITAFSNITVTQATSLITVVQAAPSVPANAFVNLLTSFTVDTVATQPVIQSQTQTSATPSTNQVTPTATVQTTTPIVQIPTYVMPDKPIIESFCDNKGNCACSSFAGSNSKCSASSDNTVHVGETLNFTIKVSGEEASGVLAFILPQEYDWVKEGGIKPWGTDLTYTKTFTTEDISISYSMYAYIKSSNDNYYRRSRGCNWISYSCDDNTQIIYTVLP